MEPYYTHEQINKVLCQHPKDKRLVYCQCDPEFYITGHICGVCLKIFDLTFEAKNPKQLPKIDKTLFDTLGR